MAAVERLIVVAEIGERLDADASGQFIDAPRQHQHERKGKLGAGDIGAAPLGEHGDAAFGAGCLVDAPQVDAVFLHGLELRCRGDLLRADRQAFNDQRARVGEVGAQLLLGFDHPHLGRVELRGLPANLVAPAGQIRLVMGEEIRVGGDAFAAHMRVEHDLHDAQKAVVLDDNEIGHSILR